MSENDLPVISPGLGSLRPLAWNELVRRGDFVRDECLAFKPWEGPGGFRADAFVKQIYRLLKPRPIAGK